MTAALKGTQKGIEREVRRANAEMVINNQKSIYDAGSKIRLPKIYFIRGDGTSTCKRKALVGAFTYDTRGNTFKKGSVSRLFTMFYRLTRYVSMICAAAASTL